MYYKLHSLNASLDAIIVTTSNERQGSLLHDDIRLVYQWIMFAVLCQTIDIFGVIANILNIICFMKQGFKDPVNASLLGLALSDLGCLLTLVFTNICLTPAFGSLDLPFDTTEFQYLTSGMPHAICTRITGCITAMIIFERCLCITAPLKNTSVTAMAVHFSILAVANEDGGRMGMPGCSNVKSIVTSKRVAIAIVCISIVIISSASPVYVVNRLGMKFFPNRNKTLLGLVYASNREEVEQVAFLVNNVFIPFSYFIFIASCTIILVYSLNSKTKWRKKSATSKVVENIAIRNQKVAKMVIMISVLFITAFIPVSVLFMAMSFVPELSINGKYVNILFIIGGLGFVFESLNSSVNIFIYYHMSSKFRAAFLEIFSRRTLS